MDSSIDNFILTAIVFLPIAGALCMLLMPGRSEQARAAFRWWALAVCLVDFLASIYLASMFDCAADAPFQFVGPFKKVYAIGGGDPIKVWIQWIPAWGVSFKFGVDGLSLLLVLLTTLLGVLAVLCSFTAIRKREKEYYIFLLLLQSGILGTFLSLDLFLFYVFWEMMLIPLYFLIGIWGSADRVYATMKFVIYTLTGSLLMLVGILVIYFAGRAANGGNPTFDYEILSQADLRLSATTEILVFLSLLLAFAIKVPVFPFHTWLPDAHTEAPTAGSVILAGVLLKTGVYGMLRFCIPLFPRAAVEMAPILAWLAVIAIIYGALTAMAQKDMKRLVAYSSVSHMGFVMLGIFGCIAYASDIGVDQDQALRGGMLQMINHGISTGGLFLCVGMIYERRHTRLMAELGGLAVNMRRYAVLTVIIVLSSVGLPGLNGFIGEFLVIVGIFRVNILWAALAGTGVILGAVYLLIMVQRVFFGPLDKPANRELRDLGFREVAILLPLIAIAFWIGLYPKPFLDLLERNSQDLIEQVQKSQRPPQTRTIVYRPVRPDTTAQSDEFLPTLVSAESRPAVRVAAEASLHWLPLPEPTDLRRISLPDHLPVSADR